MQFKKLLRDMDVYGTMEFKKEFNDGLFKWRVVASKEGAHFIYKFEMWSTSKWKPSFDFPASGINALIELKRKIHGPEPSMCNNCGGNIATYRQDYTPDYSPIEEPFVSGEGGKAKDIGADWKVYARCCQECENIIESWIDEN